MVDSSRLEVLRARISPRDYMRHLAKLIRNEYGSERIEEVMEVRRATFWERVWQLIKKLFQG